MEGRALTEYCNRRAPSDVKKVELLGSWDNFSRPYPMERDRRMGSGHWRGCHTFTDIIRDGTSPSQSPGRSGGLKMGGTYWYYVSIVLSLLAFSTSTDNTIIHSIV